MLKIYLCDDEESQLELLLETIEDEIFIKNYQMQIEYSCTCPKELLANLQEYTPKTGLYFLDIDLQSDIDGFMLAQEIRNLDPRAFIVIVTTHSEMLPLTFSYMIEPLAYIIKDNISDMHNQICNCLEKASSRYNQIAENNKNKNYFCVTTRTKRINFDVDDLYYITISSTPHILEICSRNSLTQVRGTINETITKLPDEFVKISRETIINSKYIKEYNIEKTGIFLTNDTFFQISLRKQKELKKTYGIS